MYSYVHIYHSGRERGGGGKGRGRESGIEGDGLLYGNNKLSLVRHVNEHKGTVHT